MKIDPKPFQDAEDSERVSELKRKMSEVAPLLFALGNITKHFRRQVADRTKDYDITVPQWKVLAQLSVEDGISQASLARLSEMDAMTISGILERLEARGLAVRSPNPRDSRAKIVHATPLAEERVNEIRAVAKDVYAMALEGIPQDEQVLVLNNLNKIVDNLAGSTGDRM